MARNARSPAPRVVGQRSIEDPRRRPGSSTLPGMDEVVRVTPTLKIPLGELEWRFSGSGGPGGQHANTANTRVEVVFDVTASPSLGPRQRARLLDRLGPSVRVVASDERSQIRNRALAVERLSLRLAEALKITPPRRATRPTRAANQRRLDAKRRQSERKRRRDAGDD
jgi:ribosome-associated protein